MRPPATINATPTPMAPGVRMNGLGSTSAIDAAVTPGGVIGPGVIAMTVAATALVGTGVTSDAPGADARRALLVVRRMGGTGGPDEATTGFATDAAPTSVLMTASTSGSTRGDAT